MKDRPSVRGEITIYRIRRETEPTYRLGLDNLVPHDRLRGLVNLVRHVLGCRPTVGHVVLYSKVIVRTTRIVTRREENTTVCFVLSDHVGRRGGRQDRVLADDELFDAVGGTDLEDGLDGLWGEVATVAADDERCTLCVDRIEDGLDKVFSVVLQERVCVLERSLKRNTPIAYGLLEHLDPVVRLIRRIRVRIAGWDTDLFLSPDVPGF